MTDQRPEGTSLARSVKRGVAWSTITFGLSKALAFISLLVLTRVLAPSQFGVIGAIVTVLGLIEVNSDLGMKATVVFEQEKDIGERVQTAFTVNVLIAAVLALAMFLAAPLVAGFFHARGHTGLFRLAAADILLTGLGGIHDGLLLRDLRFRTRIVTEVVGALARTGVGIALALLGFGAASLVWAMIAGTIVWAAFQWALTPFRPRFRLDLGIARSMMAYGLGASMLSVVHQIELQVDPAAVGRVLGQRALGLYTVAFRVPTLVLENIAYQVSLVAFPALARKRVTDAAGIGASTHRLIRYQALYALPLAAGMAVEAKPIVETLFSAKWLDAAGVFAAVAILSGISATTFPLGDAFKALGRQRTMVLLTMLDFPLLVGTIVVAAPLGITAVAWVRAAGELFWSALMTVTAARVLGVSVGGTLSAIWPGAVAAAGAAGGAGAVRLWSGLSAIPQIAAATLVGSLTALLALAVLAPEMFTEVREAATTLGRRIRPRAPGQPLAPDALPAVPREDVSTSGSHAGQEEGSS